MSSLLRAGTLFGPPLCAAMAGTHVMVMSGQAVNLEAPNHCGGPRPLWCHGGLCADCAVIVSVHACWPLIHVRQVYMLTVYIGGQAAVIVGHDLDPARRLLGQAVSVSCDGPSTCWSCCQSALQCTGDEIEFEQVASSSILDQCLRPGVQLLLPCK